MYLNHYRAGAGEPLVLIHGIGSQWQMWSPVLGRLQRQREVIALDLPGFGASPMPAPGTAPGVPSLAQLVAQFVDELGLERPHVAGNSLGGWIALELAKMGRVRSATGISPAGFHEGFERRYEAAVLRAMRTSARLMAARAESFVASELGRELLLALAVSRPTNVSPYEAATSLRTLAGAGWFEETLSAARDDRFRDGEQIQVPVTIAWGTRDRILLPRQAPRAEREVAGAKLVMLRGCGHVPTWDDPERVAQVILQGSSSSS